MSVATLETVPVRVLAERLEWRYAVKKFDPSKKIPADVWAGLEKCLLLSASSYGLQPYKFILVMDPALRRKLTPASFGQPQVEASSHFVVFAGRTDIDEKDIDRFIARIAQVRGVKEESLADYRSAMVGDLVKGPRHAWVAHWAARQAYIALGTLLTAAAAAGVDACPMEGFNPDAYDEILGLKAQGLHALCACALGTRSPDDEFQHFKKVRFGKETLLQVL
jgi:nitroreductase